MLKEITDETFVDFVSGTPARAQSDQAVVAAGQVLIPVTDGPRRTAYLVSNRFNPSPATRALLDVLGVGAPPGRASADDY